jgi:long-chain fatty acid transport protein
LSWPTLSNAGGFRILDQGASATAQSGAFTAQADDASAVYYNPAGMTQLKGVQVSLGTNFLGGGTDYTGPEVRTTGNFGNSPAWPPPSNFYVTARLKDLGISALGDTTVGLAALPPFGLSYRYPDTGPFSTATINATLELIDIKPTIAYKLNDKFSVGLGADIYTFLGTYNQKFASPGVAGLPAAGTPTEINGRDTAAGFNASFLFTPILSKETGKPLVNVGLVYRSQVTLHLDGDLLANGGLVDRASTTLVLPQIITGGIAIWPYRERDAEWKLELDVDYTGWKSLRNLDIHRSSGVTIASPHNWRSGYMVMLGTEYKWLELQRLPQWEVALRAGYFNAPTVVPDRTFTPAVPDADQHNLSVGLGLFCKAAGHLWGIPCGNPDETKRGLKGIGMDLSYHALLYEQRTIAGNQNSTVDGKYSTTFHVGSVNIRANF